MVFQDWAPKPLVEMYGFPTDKESEEFLLGHVPEGSTPMTKGEAARYLEFLLSDQRMMKAWKTLSRRINDEKEYYEFYLCCMKGMQRLKQYRKITPSKRKSELRRISKLAQKLKTALNLSQELKYFTALDYTVDNPILTLTGLIEDLHESIDYSNIDDLARNLIETVSMSSVLDGISSVTNDLRKSKPALLKPNAPNSDSHFLIRHLCHYGLVG